MRSSGATIGHSEDETFWHRFLRLLSTHGLAGVRLVISDRHAGLVAALRRGFQGSAHQRCRLLALVPSSHQNMVAAVFRTTFAQPNADAVSSTRAQVRDPLASMVPRIGPLMDDAISEVIAFTSFPRAQGQRIWSTNPPERITTEIKRRSHVMGIFPDEAPVSCLVGAVLADLHDAWQAGARHSFSKGSMAMLYPERDTDPVAEINSGD